VELAGLEPVTSGCYESSRWSFAHCFAWRMELGAVLAHRVPNHVPNPANLTASYPAEPAEASLNRRENERQRANHDPRVRGFESLLRHCESPV
jgi:hypothetical protein